MKGLTLHGKLLVIIGALLIVALLAVVGLGLRRVVRLHKAREKQQPTEQATAPIQQPIDQPVRPIPPTFARDTYRPNIRESQASGSVNPELFSPGRDLVYVDDPRGWWENDNDKNDTECDHSVHRSVETPLRRLIELVDQRDGILEVQDAYRPSGVHSAKSLHKEGRAVDVTCDELGLEELAKLAWAAGFDWVYYEASSRGGAHVHVSVKR